MSFNVIFVGRAPAHPLQKAKGGTERKGGQSVVFQVREVLTSCPWRSQPITGTDYRKKEDLDLWLESGPFSSHTKAK